MQPDFVRVSRVRYESFCMNKPSHIDSFKIMPFSSPIQAIEPQYFAAETT